MKATALLMSLPSDTVDVVMTHPAQVRALSLIEELIEELGESESPLDYRTLQGALVGNLHEVEERRSQCTGAFKRLQRGGALPDVPDLPAGRDKQSVNEWELEIYIFARIARQLRTIGDGIAWRCFGYDRRAIVTLARNQSAGAMYGKKGLNRELGFIEEFWARTGQFALHHDSTNCLRIADVTEFHLDGKIRFVEVKTSDRKRSGQTQRAQQAVDALTDGGPLPGAAAGARLAQVPVPYATNLDDLHRMLDLAEIDGVSGAGLQDGRALFAVDVTALVVTRQLERDLERMQQHRDDALEQAGMLKDSQHIVGRSVDTATRSPLMVPFSIYPFQARQCARLICDYLSFETTLSVDALAAVCRESGLSAEIKLPSRHDALHGDVPVLSIGRGDRILTLHNEGLTPLMYELVDPRQWVLGIRELLTRDDLPPEPQLVFIDESATWR